MESCVREMQKRLRRAPTKRAKNKSVLQQRSLGTIKKRKAEKRTDEQSVDDNLDVILRLLRMRPNTSDFLQQQFATMGSLQAAMGTTPSKAVPTQPPVGPSLQHFHHYHQSPNFSPSPQHPSPHMQKPHHPSYMSTSPQQRPSPSSRPSLTQRLSKTVNSSYSGSAPSSPTRDHRASLR